MPTTIPVRLPASHLAVAAAAAITALGCAAALGSAARPGAVARAQGLPPGCTIRDTSKGADRTAVPIGGSARLDWSWRWVCNATKPGRDVLVIVDPTTAFAADADAARRAANVRAALGGFADRLGWVGGGRFGTISAACPPAVISPMASGAAAHAAWRDALLTLPSQRERDVPGAYALAAAVIDALARDGQPPPIVLIVDADGAACPAATPMPGAADACAALTATGAHTVFVRLSPTTERLPSCRTPGWFFRSNSRLGADLPGLMDEIAARLARGGPLPDSASTTVWLDPRAWEWVGAEPEPAATFPDVLWERPVAGQLSGEVSVALTVRAKDGAVPGSHRIEPLDGFGPLAALRTGDGVQLPTLRLVNPSICIFRPGRELEDCSSTASPPPTDPPEPTSTADARPSATPSPDPVPPGHRLWLPWASDAVRPATR